MVSFDDSLGRKYKQHHHEKGLSLSFFRLILNHFFHYTTSWNNELQNQRMQLISSCICFFLCLPFNIYISCSSETLSLPTCLKIVERLRLSSKSLPLTITSVTPCVPSILLEESPSVRFSYDKKFNPTEPQDSLEYT